MGGESDIVVPICVDDTGGFDVDDADFVAGAALLLLLAGLSAASDLMVHLTHKPKI
jgi:hypothetical protein